MHTIGRSWPETTSRTHRWRLLAVATLFASFALPVAASDGPGAEPEIAALERAIEARRAIGEVYWNQRLWPESNESAKPSYAAMVDEGKLLSDLRRVEKKRALLAMRWGIEIDGEMLQTELRRIARSSRDKRRLQQIFDALDGDAQLAAEHIALPVLVDRLLEGVFARDHELHSATREAIDPQWKESISIAGFSARATDAERRTVRRSGTSRSAGSRFLTDGEWNANLNHLRAVFDVTEIRAGLVTPLLEDEHSFYRMGIESFDGHSLTTLTRSWPKQGLDSFVDDASAGVLDPIEPPAGGFQLPDLPETDDAVGSCTLDTWRDQLQQQPESRFGHTAVWTGTEMIVFGGSYRGSFNYGNGGRYDPVTDTWSQMSEVNGPGERVDHTAVWTGTEMIIWGGSQSGSGAGARYNPSTDTWSTMTLTNAPIERQQHVAVWTGTEMIVWGGWESGGGRYDPSTDTWSSMSTSGAHGSQPNSTAVWTGSEMLMFGGGEEFFDANSEGTRYDPVTDTWSSLPFFPQDDRVMHTAVWTGSEMIIHAGLGIIFDSTYGEEIENPLNTGAMFNPVTNSWDSIFSPNFRWAHTAVWTGSEMIVYGGQQASATAERFDPVTENFVQLPPDPLVETRSEHTAVWTGNEMIVWGGVSIFDPFFPISSGVKWTPSSSSWSATYESSNPNPRGTHAAVWTGSEMFVFGGRGFSGRFESGGLYDPALNDWRNYSFTDVPSFRERNQVVWTGTEVIVWGGRLSDWRNDGGRYNPTTDTWTDTTTTGAPTARGSHATTWTGSEMLVWGGSGAAGSLDDGARYDPVADSWTPMSTTNAPSARTSTSFAWTGTQAFVFGGSGASDGGLYDPASDTWTPISTTGAPSGRSNHVTVWTGSEILVWGGSADSAGTDTGGHYDPVTDTWTPTSLTNAPTQRTEHAGVWTGTELVVWGGRQTSLDWDTGGRYDPVTQTWTATSQSDAPTARYQATGVWTGNELLIWGGRIDNSFFNPDNGAYCASASCTPTDWYRDDDSDGFGQTNDVISDCNQPAGYSALPGDCNDADGSVYGTPGETQDLLLTDSSIDWSAPNELGGTPASVLYDLLRSSQANDFNAATCVESSSSSTSSSDPADPAPSSAFFYLSRARNTCPADNIGTLGSDSSGTERAGTACP